MKILKLYAENYKRLSVVEITPTENLVKITGKNAAGKSSILDSIWSVLDNAAAKQPRPIKEGKDEATISLDFGEMRVTRTFRRKDGNDYTTNLRVENADGSRPSKPQTLIDELMGKLTMDPVEFLRMAPKDQFEALKVFVPDFNFAAFDGANATDFEKRTDLNRQAKQLRAQAAGIAAPSERPATADVDALVKSLEEAGTANADVATRLQNRKNAADKAVTARAQAQKNRDRIQQIKEQIDRLNVDIANLTQEAAELDAAAKTQEERLANAGPAPEPVDTSKISEEITAARKLNEGAAAFDRKAEIVKEAERIEAEATALTEAMDARKEHKRAAIAKAKMPVPGLTLEDDMVLFNGVPLEQASDAERLRISAAVAMAGKPEIRVLRIRDGERLDSDGLKLLAKMAKDKDFQVWVEAVDETGKSGVVMVDGRVASVNPSLPS